MHGALKSGSQFSVPVHFNLLASNAGLVSQLSTQIPIKKRSFSASINPRRTGPGRGLQGRGRGFDMGSITVPDRSLQRQKKPSVTHVFCKLRSSFSLSRQRSRVRAPSSPPFIPEELIGIGGINRGAKGPLKCVPFAPRFTCCPYIRLQVSWRSELRVRLRFRLGRKDKRHNRRLGRLLCWRNCLGIDIERRSQ